MHGAAAPKLFVRSTRKLRRSTNYEDVRATHDFEADALVKGVSLLSSAKGEALRSRGLVMCHRGSQHCATDALPLMLWRRGHRVDPT